MRDSGCRLSGCLTLFYLDSRSLSARNTEILDHSSSHNSVVINSTDAENEEQFFIRFVCLWIEGIRWGFKNTSHGPLWHRSTEIGEEFVCLSDPHWANSEPEEHAWQNRADVQQTASGDSPLGPGKQEQGSFLLWVHHQQESEMSRKPRIGVLVGPCSPAGTQSSWETNQLFFLTYQAAKWHLRYKEKSWKGKENVSIW